MIAGDRRDLIRQRVEALSDEQAYEDDELIEAETTREVYRKGKRSKKPRALTEAEYIERADKLRAMLFKQQLDLIVDKWRYKCAVVPRRGGKTLTGNVYMLDVACRKAGANIAYVTLTKQMADLLMWSHPGWDSMKNLNKKFDLRMRFNETVKFATLQNGSRISLFGLDKRRDIEKLLGGKYDLVIIDECASIMDGMLRTLIFRALGPAMNDYGGTIMLIGSPAYIPDGVFYEACPWTLVKDPKNEDKEIPGWDQRAFVEGGEEMQRFIPYKDRRKKAWRGLGKTARWSAHRWDVKDNVKMPQLWKRALEDKEMNKWGDMHPTWLRQYLGICVVDPASRVFDVGSAQTYEPPLRKNGAPALDPYHEWQYMLGIAFGEHGRTAITVAATAEDSTCMYHCETVKDDGLLVFDLGFRLAMLEQRYGGFTGCTIYGASDAMVEAISRRFELSAEKCDHRDEDGLIRILKSDLRHGGVKVRAKSPLLKEMNRLHRRKGLDGEFMDGYLDTCEMEALRSFLWLIPMSMHDSVAPREIEPPKGSPEWRRALHKGMFDRALKRRRDEGMSEIEDEVLKGFDDYEDPDKDWWEDM